MTEKLNEGKKLDRCVQHVRDQGKSKDSAYAICVKSTGIKKKKGGGWTKGKKSLKECTFNDRFQDVMEYLEEKKGKPSAGLTKKKKSAIVKKAKKGEDIGKKGKGFKKVAAKAAKQYGSKEKGKKVAAAALWKNIKR